MRKLPVVTLALLVMLIAMTTYLVLLDERVPAPGGDWVAPERPVGWSHVYLRVL